jgi:hypothetical protein
MAKGQIIREEFNKISSDLQQKFFAALLEGILQSRGRKRNFGSTSSCFLTKKRSREAL